MDKINLADSETVDRLYMDMDPDALLMLGVSDPTVNTFVLEDFSRESEGSCMSVSVFPCNRVMLVAEGYANMVAWTAGAPPTLLCGADILISLLTLEGDGRAHAVSLLRNTMLRLLELLDSGDEAISGWEAWANFVVPWGSSKTYAKHNSAHVARTYYQSILRQLDQMEG